MSMRAFHCILIGLAAGCSIVADAFLTPSTSNSHPGFSKTTSISAYIFGMQEESNDNDPLQSEWSALRDDDYDDDYDKTGTTTTTTTTTVMGRLNDQKASLARVVAAFPPTGHALDLNHIENVQVLQVDNQHIDIEATLCEEESCSAVSVPIDFPHPCTSTTTTTTTTTSSYSSGSSSLPQPLDECILENLDVLDHEAELLLQHAEFEALNTNQEYHTVTSDDKEGGNSLLDNGDRRIIDFPSWWIAPPTEMVHERETLQNLLNEAEFASELQAMAQLGLGQSVLEAKVCSIGPAGMIIRARLPPAAPESAADHHDDDVVVVEVPISFPAAAYTVDQLRDQVLAAIDSVAMTE